MASKQLTFGSEAREKLLRGAGKLADAVRITLGPKSKSVLLQKQWGTPIVCNDGVMIAKELTLEDAEENLGAQMLRQAAEKTGDAVGDGTSTSTVLAHAILAEGVKNVTAGASGIDLKRGLDRAARTVVAELTRMTKPVTSRKEKIQVATISAHNDEAIGTLVADAMEKVGGDGIITVEESKSTETALECVEGMQFDRGYLSPYFVTDSDRMEAVLEDAFVLVTDRKLRAVKELIALLEDLVKSAKPVLLIADDVESEALATLLVNQVRGVLKCAAVKAPGYGDQRKVLLQDIAVLTGARVLSEELGMKLEDAKIESLGRAKRIIVDKDTTTIVGGLGARSAVEARIKEVRHELEKKDLGAYDREKLEKRLARLTGGVAVIRVGAPSEAEMKAKKDALDDAISAAKAAVAEGIVPGAGLALLRASKALAATEGEVQGDERTGVQILARALQAPARQIAENSAVDGGVVVSKMLESQGNVGFDAATNRYVDLFEAGIIDPTKVVRIALENAVSVAGVLLLSEATMTEKRVEKEARTNTAGDGE
jgi:chaperonin GroEL